ncbi:PD-(D/E)XK nuclease family protein [Bacteroidota bacterium]
MTGILKAKKKQIENYQPYDEEFTESLQELLAELFNPLIPFIQTEEEQHCGYCPYVSICKKTKKENF